MGYTKLFSDIVMSTVWREPDHVRLVWITMLACKDRHHVVNASIPGLAHAARVSIAQCEKALKRLSEPDPYSRTTEYEGRRIETCEGGWIVLNGAKYRQKLSMDEQAEKARIRKARQRERDKSRNVTECHATNRDVTTDTDTDTDKEEECASSRRTATLFEDFWKAYPVKKEKKAARKVWLSKGLDAEAGDILTAVALFSADDPQWQKGFIPHPTTFLRGERWKDEIDPTNGDRGFV